MVEHELLLGSTARHAPQAEMLPGPYRLSSEAVTCAMLRGI
ncbi:hypothetical protein ACFSLT_19970 [Novosphingobium resinovorum]